MSNSNAAGGGTGGLGSPTASADEEPFTEPVNGQVFPPFMPRSDRPGRNTNQLKYVIFHSFLNFLLQRKRIIVEFF